MLTDKDIEWAHSTIFDMIGRGLIGREIHDVDVRANLQDALAILLAKTAPKTTHDPRPSDMTELARSVAKELRKRGIWASSLSDGNPTLTAIAVPAVHNGKAGFLRMYSLLFGQFDNLGPKGCADLIQQEERRRAQEWAGDE